MAKKTTLFCCNSCGHETQKWLGRCPGCSEWNTLEEVSAVPARRKAAKIGALPLVALNEIPAASEERFVTAIGEFDRVLSGGMVSGSVVLIGGDPGIGKSTLLLQG